MVKKGSLSTSPSSTSTTLSAEPDIALAVEISKRYCAKTPNFHKVLDSALLFFLIKGVIVFIYGLLTRDAYRTFLGGFLPPVAMFVFVMSLRCYTQEDSKDDKSTEYQILGSFMCSFVIFFLAIINHIQ